MLLLEEKIEKRKQKNYFSVPGYYSRDRASLTNEPQRLYTLVCLLCKQIANNAVELHCDEMIFTQAMENVQLNNITITDFRKIKYKTKYFRIIEHGNESDLNSKRNCNYKGNIKKWKTFEQLQNVAQDLQSQLELEKLQIKQIDNLKTELLIKDQQIIGLTKDIQQLKIELSQNMIRLQRLKRSEQYQNKIDTRATEFERNRNIQANIERLTVQRNAQNKKKEGYTDYIAKKNCSSMLSFIKNGVDFLLLNESNKTTQLKTMNGIL
ncbi:hypothetical protein RFI_20410 [Reticulomyxa filosa]|uniref:Viral A-type inclusion protein n=1 Tax=Reticulomyxa filosa TaxID=46433 RepID=X6MSJ7_RETFI|nr:hypothetical protein RFI_20410 [Reticulomyxa filosa]|eukprot:ETO16928.1 hypothetical protein RFI_20410 [Reticulomyxa filosa]